MKNKRSLWISLLSVVAIIVIALSAVLAAGWSPKLGLDLDGGLSVVYQTHRPVNQDQLNTIVTILNNRVNAGTSGATVDSQGTNQISVSIPGEKNSQKVLATLGNTAQLLFRPALCYAPAFSVAKGASPSTGPLPTCSASSALTQATCRSRPIPTTCNGYTSNTQYPARHPVRHLPLHSVDRRQQEPDSAPAGHRRQRGRPLRPGSGRPHRHRRPFGQRPAQQRPVGGQPQPHRRRLHAVGHHGPAAVPPDHRHRPRRPGHLGPHHPAVPGLVHPVQRPGADLGQLHRGPGQDPGHRLHLRRPAGQARPADRRRPSHPPWARPRCRPGWWPGWPAWPWSCCT